MDGFTYPGMGPAAANPWAFLQQQPPGMQQQQQMQYATTGAVASAGAPASSEAQPMLAGLTPQHMLQTQQQQQAGGGGSAAAWGGMHGFHLPANFLPAGLGMPDGGGGGGAAGYPSMPGGVSPMGHGGQHVGHAAMRGQGGVAAAALGGVQQQQHQHQQQAMLHQQHPFGGQLHPGLPQGQVPLHVLHAGGMPREFMPQFGGGGGGSTMVPSAMVQSGVVPDPSPSPCAGADGGLQAVSPQRRHSAERREVAKSAARLSIPPGGVRPLPPSGSPAEGGRRRSSSQIEPQGWAGQLVWAKLAKYPWWPAQVLAEDDPYIPAGSEPPRRGAVPVRFFGTYDFSWIESQRMLQPFQEGFADKSLQQDEGGFAASVQEAQDFLATAELPEGFELALLEQDDDVPQAEPAPPKPKLAAPPAKRKAAAAGVSATDGAPPRARSRAAAKPQARKLDPVATGEQLQKIRQSMALEAPSESPFAEAACLDGLQQLLGQA